LSDSPGRRQPSQFGSAIEALITGGVVLAALATRYPGITQAIRDASLGAMLAVAGLYGVLIISRNRLPVALRWVVASCVSLIGLYVASVLWTPTPTLGALRPAAQLILVFGWILFAYGTSDQKASRGVYVATLLAFLLIQGFLWAQAGFAHPFTGSVVRGQELLHKNVLGAFAAAALFFMLATDTRRTGTIARTIGVILSVALLWASGSRGSQLSVLVAAAVYLAWPLVIRRRWTYHAVFACLVIASSAFVYYYLALSRSDALRRTALPDITGQSLYSGRELLWPIVLQYVGERPLLGWGGIDQGMLLMNAGFGPHVFGARTMNAHNLYLAVALQTGVIGLLLLMAILYSVWLRFYCGRQDRTVRLVAASFIGICVHQLFETSLIQTNVSIGVLFWAIIAVGLGKSDALQRSYGSPVGEASGRNAERVSALPPEHAHALRSKPHIR
jgi:hypothetical protein